MRPRLTYARVTTALAAVLAIVGAAVALAGGHGNAGSLDGTKIKRFDFAADAGDGSKTILKAGDLRMKATCAGDGTLTAEVSTTSNDAAYYSYGGNTDDSVADFDTGSPEEISIGAERDGVYEPANGDRVAIQYLTLEDGQHDCNISGFAFIGAEPKGSGSASTVGGVHLKTINYKANEGSAKKTILKAGDLSMTAECTPGPIIDVKAKTASNNALFADYPGSRAKKDFDKSDPISFDPDYEDDVVYRSANGHTVAVQFLNSDGAQSADCLAGGIAWVK